MNGHRQAAAALYELDAHDQQAILAELPQTDQEILRGLLAELAELGFERGVQGDLSVPAPEVAHAPGKVAGEEPAVELRRVLRNAAPASMLAVLRDEPVSLQACLLSLERWPWSDAYLELLAPARRKAVADALHVGIVDAPARTLFLLESVAAALPRSVEAPAPVRKGWLTHTLSRLGSWTR